MASDSGNLAVGAINLGGGGDSSVDHSGAASPTPSDGSVDERQGLIAGEAAAALPPSSVKQKGGRKSNLFWATFNLWNDVLASGTVALPFYVSLAGVGMAPIMFVSIGCLTALTLRMVYELCRKYQQRNYGELCLYGLGRPGYIAACFFMFGYNYGALLAALLMIGSNVPALLTGLTGVHTVFFGRRLVLAFFVAVVSPLAFMQNIADYAIMSFASMLCVLTLLSTIIFQAIFRPPHSYGPRTEGAYDFVRPLVFQAFGGMAYLFVCHDLSVAVFDQFLRATPRRWTFVVGVVISMTVVLATATGLLGYTLWTGNTSANILENFAEDDPVAIVGRIALSLNVVISIPYSTYMPRLALLLVIKLFWRQLPRRVELILHFVLTVIVLGSVLLIAELVTNLGVTITLVGAVSAVGLGFIMPPLLVLRIEPGPFWLPRKLIAAVILVFGITAMVMGATTSLQSAFFPGD